MGANWSESKKRSSKKCGVSFKSDGSKDDEYLKKKRSFATVRLFLSACMISCVSLRMNDSQGCTADVKDTHPSPKEKPDNLIGPDIDPVGDHDDLMAERNRLSIQSFESGVSFKSDRSKDGLIHFKDRVSPSRLDLSSFEKKHAVADDGFFESSDDQEEMNQELSSEVGWKHG